MKKILIFGAGGFGREVQWLIERINQKEPLWQIEGYLDDNLEPGTEINGYKVLGSMEKLREYDDSLSVACAVVSARIREKIVSEIKQTGNFQFPNLIDPDVRTSEFLSMGEGNIIFAGNILTVNIVIKDFVILNLACTTGYDAVLESFVTVHSGVNIAECVRIQKGVELGTGSKVIQGKTIGEYTFVGAASLVNHDLPSECMATGLPAKPVKFYGKGYNKLLITGASGHGKVIFELAGKTGLYDEIYFLDDDEILLKTEETVVGSVDFAINHRGEFDVIIAVGNAFIRRQIQEKYERAGVNLVTLIHPEGILSDETARIGKGTVIMAGAVIQTGVAIGDGVIVNTSASIDHECEIGDFSHISVGSHLAGNVKVGNNTWIGAGAVISNNVCICDDVTVGAGAVVVKDITESGTYVGIPAKKITK